MIETHWTVRDKWRFVWRYFTYKLLILEEVRSPKFSFLLFELQYSFANLLNTIFPRLRLNVVYKGPESIHTSTGRFLVRSGSHDAAIISPAFERDDVNFLMKVLQRELQENGKIAFLDVGANIGSFTVRAGLYDKAKGIEILAFEPIPENVRLLEQNLKLNQLSSKVSVYPFALSNWNGASAMSFSPTHPGDSKISKEERRPIQMRTLDALNRPLPSVLVLKMDIEGHEKQALEGMKETLKKSKKCWLCIEDMFDRQDLSDFLVKQGFHFQTKLTPYNSWWLLQN